MRLASNPWRNLCTMMQFDSWSNWMLVTLSARPLLDIATTPKCPWLRLGFSLLILCTSSWGVACVASPPWVPMRSWVLPPQAVSCVNLAVASVCAHPRMLGTYRKHKRHVPTLLREAAMCTVWRYRVLCVCVHRAVCVATVMGLMLFSRCGGG